MQFSFLTSSLKHAYFSCSLGAFQRVPVHILPSAPMRGCNGACCSAAARSAATAHFSSSPPSNLHTHRHPPTQSTHPHIHTSTHPDIHISTHLRLHPRPHTPTTHTHTHAHTHTHTHTHIAERRVMRRAAYYTPRPLIMPVVSMPK